MTRRIFLFLASTLFSLLPLCAQTAFEQNCVQLAGRLGNDSERLHDLFKLDWEHAMIDSPEFATEVGYPGQNDRWTDRSLEAIERRKRELQAPMKVIQSIDRAKLGTPELLDYDLFKKDKEDAIEGTRFKEEYAPLTQLDGVQQDTAKTLDESPHSMAKDYQ